MEDIEIAGYSGDITVRKTRDGDYGVVIRIPFITKGSAKSALGRMVKKKNDKISKKI